MKLIRKTIAASLLAILAQGALATDWTYNGNLTDNGKPANGKYDVRLTLVDANNTPIRGGITVYGVDVEKGSFSTKVDFGVDPRTLTGARLLTEVQQGASGFFALGEAKAINGGLAECWDIDGNTTTGNNATIGLFDSTQGLLPIRNNGSNGSSTLWLNRTGGIEQDGSTASGDNSAAWNTSNALGAGSFTAGRGRTGPNGTNSFAFSDTPITVGADVPGYSDVPGQFLVKTTGSIGFNYTTTSSFDDVQIGPRSGGDADVDLALYTRSGKKSSIYTLDSTGELVMVGFGGLSLFGGATPMGIHTSGPGFTPAYADVVIGARFGAGSDEDVDLFFRSGGTPIRAGRITLSQSDGNFRFFPGLPPGAEGVDSKAAPTAMLTAGGTWTNASSRTLKEGFGAINALEVLNKVASLPITTWTYKGSSEGTHMGPVAEDFKETFGLAGDGKSIGTVDADGVALAAIQGLNIKLTQAEEENAALKARLEALEAKLGD
jgi:hypothetical protein